MEGVLRSEVGRKEAMIEELQKQVRRLLEARAAADAAERGGESGSVVASVGANKVLAVLEEEVAAHLASIEAFDAAMAKIGLNMR